MKKSLRKIIAAICMGTMLLSCTAYGADSSQNLMAYTDNVLSDGSLIYYFEEVAVTLPADWQGKVQIETTDNSATFYHKASHEKWQEKYGQEGGKLFTLSCTVNHDFQELPDFTYIGFSDQSVMNYFMIFPTDFQAYTDDSAIAAEFQQMNTEIDFVKQHAYMLSEGDNNTVSAAEPAKIPTTEPEATPTTEPAAIPTTEPVAVPNTEEYTGSWVQIMDEFEICLLPDWEEVELDEEALALLDEKYQILMCRMEEQPVVQITYFQPDERKEGGSYVTVTGVVRRVDDVMKKITMQDGNEIEMEKILNVEEVSYQDRVDIAKSLFGIISDDVTLEDAKEEQIKRW